MLELAVHYATMIKFQLCLGHVSYAFEVPARAFKHVFQLIRSVQSEEM